MGPVTCIRKTFPSEADAALGTTGLELLSAEYTTVHSQPLLGQEELWVECVQAVSASFSLASSRLTSLALPVPLNTSHKLPRYWTLERMRGIFHI